MPVINEVPGEDCLSTWSVLLAALCICSKVMFLNLTCAKQNRIRGDGRGHFLQNLHLYLRTSASLMKSTVPMPSSVRQWTLKCFKILDLLGLYMTTCYLNVTTPYIRTRCFSRTCILFNLHWQEETVLFSQWLYVNMLPTHKSEGSFGMNVCR